MKGATYWGVLLALCVWAANPPATLAQNAGDEEAEAATEDESTAADTAPAPVVMTKPGQFPPSPYGFYRGNDPRSRNQAGWYLSLMALIPVLGLFILWAWTAKWVDSDSRSLKVRSEFWNTMILGCGFVGFLAVLCFSPFVLGFAVLLIAYGVPTALYVGERNKRVPEHARILTPDHIRNHLVRTLARVGIHIGSKEAQEEAFGPSITFYGKSGKDDNAARSRQVENSRGYLAAKQLIYDAIERRSTDVHLEPKDDELAVRIRIDGVMYPTEPFDRAVGDAVINIFKVLGAMDITEKRRPQDGSFRADVDARDVDFRVATQGTRHGEKMSLRILDQSNSVSTLPGLGLRKSMQDKLTELIHQPHGLLLCCGPTGAGKSTTLYAALSSLDAYQRNIITVEDPVEYKIDNVTQIEINTKAGQTFGQSLRSILRQDPDVVMIGEIRDAETGSIACQAANTGHMVFSTLHANDTITALYRLLELGVEPYMVSNSVSAIIGQRLARRLCTECREAYKPNPAFLKKAGLPPDKIDVFYRPPKEPEVECPKCAGLGYSGRIGVYETLVMTDRMRDLVRDKTSISAIKAEARKNGMLSMKEEGLRLVVQGITSIEELLRIVK